MIASTSPHSAVTPDVDPDESPLRPSRQIVTVYRGGTSVEAKDPYEQTKFAEAQVERRKRRGGPELDLDEPTRGATDPNSPRLNRRNRFDVGKIDSTLIDTCEVIWFRLSERSDGSESPADFDKDLAGLKRMLRRVYGADNVRLVGETDLTSSGVLHFHGFLWLEMGLNEAGKSDIDRAEVIERIRAYWAKSIKKNRSWFGSVESANDILGVLAYLGSHDRPIPKGVQRWHRVNFDKFPVTPIQVETDQHAIYELNRVTSPTLPLRNLGAISRCCTDDQKAQLAQALSVDLPGTIYQPNSDHSDPLLAPSRLIRNQDHVTLYRPGSGTIDQALAETPIQWGLECRFPQETEAQYAWGTVVYRRPGAIVRTVAYTSAGTYQDADTGMIKRTAPPAPQPQGPQNCLFAPGSPWPVAAPEARYDDSELLASLAQAARDAFRADQFEGDDDGFDSGNLHRRMLAARLYRAEHAQTMETMEAMA